GIGAQRVTALIDNNTAASVINALFERRYRIVHVAAHGEPVTKTAQGGLLSKGGVVLSEGSFLGSDEINSMRTVPELVFVNCCHLAARDSGRALSHDTNFNRAEFAWGLADSLIEIGVRCVIAAGWAVDDHPAEVFATTFYREILARKPFISAVAAAREAAWNEDRSSNTWAAYQAYGDPNWVYRRGSGGPGDTASAPIPPREEFEGIASPLGLSLALEELAVKSKWMRADGPVQLEKIRHLEARFAPLWGGMGAVAEAYGQAYAEAGDHDAAIAWYERALQANDASAQVKAFEQLANLRARRAWQLAEAADAKPAVLAQARRDIQRALQDLQALAGLQQTLERASLIGSSYKRLALLEGRLGNTEARSKALASAAAAYEQAEELALASHNPDAFYPALNRMALQLVVNGGQPGWPGFKAETSAAVRRSLQTKAETDPDFWCFAGQMELDMYEAVAERRLARQAPALIGAYTELNGRVAARNYWASVADQALLVLEPYAAASRGAERDAAAALLQALQAYAR
ncbi:MAG TPA: CHAT domain-containing protein, partial [Rubrivivax sp.]|nr:CHAT domain-containing protein [Rubrivivax sp.]